MEVLPPDVLKAADPLWPWGLVSASMAMWTAIFLIARGCGTPGIFCGQTRATVLDWYNREVSILHATVSCIFAALVANAGLSVVENARNTVAEEAVMAFSLGYFLYDFIACEFQGLSDMANTIHHVISVTLFGSSLLAGQSGSVLVYGILCTEPGTPFVHLRMMLKNTTAKNSTFFKANEMLAAVAFFVCRFVFGTWIFWFRIFPSPEHSLIAKILGAGIHLLSLYWLMLMIRVVTRPAKTMKASSKHD